MTVRVEGRREESLTISQLRLLCFFGLFRVTVTISEASRETRTSDEGSEASERVVDAATDILRRHSREKRGVRVEKEWKASMMG